MFWETEATDLHEAETMKPLDESAMLAVRRRIADQGTVYGLFTYDGDLAYIGTTTGMAHDRWKAHMADPLKRKMVVRVLERCAKEKRWEREQWWIAGYGL